MRRRFTAPSIMLFLSSIILLSSISRPCASAEVITLTAETFSDKIEFMLVNTKPRWQSLKHSFVSIIQVQEKDTAWFVKFCVPWCKHCKSLGTLWEELGKEMEGEDEIEVGEVDCATQKSVCSKVDIHSYPTFKLFYNGEEVTKYQGTRDVESLKIFALQETEKAAEKQVDNDGEL